MNLREEEKTIRKTIESAIMTCFDDVTGWKKSYPEYNPWVKYQAITKTTNDLLIKFKKEPHKASTIEREVRRLHNKGYLARKMEEGEARWQRTMKDYPETLMSRILKEESKQEKEMNFQKTLEQNRQMFGKGSLHEGED